MASVKTKESTMGDVVNMPKRQRISEYGVPIIEKHLEDGTIIECVCIDDMTQENRDKYFGHAAPKMNLTVELDG